MKKSSVLVVVAIIAGALPCFAAQVPLSQAYIKKIINDVKVVDPRTGSHSARLDEVIKDDLSVRTGIRSRCELLFQDNTLTRLGAETSFSFKPGTRNMTLGEGTMLLQVPKDHGGAVIRAASVSASITGTTVMIENLPAASVKFLVLEGSMKLSVVGRIGENLNLGPGQMVIMNPAAKRLPEPVVVDIRKVMKTSSLVNPNLFKGDKAMKVDPLPSVPLMEEAASKQDTLRSKGQLKETNLAILGNGTKAVTLDEATKERLDRAGDGRTQTGSTDSRTTAAMPDASSAPGDGRAGNHAGNSSGAGTQTGSTDSRTTAAMPDAGSAPGDGRSGNHAGNSSTEVDRTIISDSVDDSNSGNPQINIGGNGVANTPPVPPPPGTDSDGSPVVPPPTNPGSNAPPDPLTTPGATGLLVNGVSVHPTGLIIKGTDGDLFTAPTSGRTVTFVGPEVRISPESINGVDATGGNATAATTSTPGGTVTIAGGGGDGGTIYIGTNLSPVAGQTKIKSPITAVTGDNFATTPYGGAGGTVKVFGNDRIRVESTIKVSSATSASGGNILLDARATSGSGIEIGSSGSLLSLLDAAAPGPGGKITFRSDGSRILVEGTVIAERGIVDIQNRGGGSGAIVLDTAQIRGDVVKIGALARGGELVIDGGIISADTMLKLYGGEVSGGVRFVENTTLGGAGTKMIAGRSVTIDDGKRVDIQGGSAAAVFAQNANYTGSGGNNTTTGAFIGRGAVTHPLPTRPGF